MNTFQLANRKSLFLIILALCFLSMVESKVLAQNGFINPDIDLTVTKLVLQPDGKILIAGAFNIVGGQTRRRIARLNANGSLASSFRDPNISEDSGNVALSAIALQPDGKIVIGGRFNSVDGQVCNKMARLNSDGTLDATFTADVNNSITAIQTQSDGKILIGGFFTSVGGQARNHVARLNHDGTLDASFEDPNVNAATGSPAYPIGTLAIQPDGKILISGYFTSVGGQTRSGSARLNPNGTLDTSFNLNISDIASQFLFQPDGKILVCGYFRTVNGVPRTGMARINADGSLDESFQNVKISSGTVSVFALQADGRVMIGGSFGNINEYERRDLARLNADGTLDTSFKDPNANFGGTFYSVYSITVQPDGKILVGGQFDMVGGQARKMVVRLLGDGSLDLPPAQILTITKTADTNDGVCNSDCSLREAVAAANANAESSQINFSIPVFSAPQTITLTSGELVVADNHRLTIYGPGAELLTISGNNQSRVFRINRDAIVHMNGLTITGGNGEGEYDAGNGGAIYVSPNGFSTTLILDNISVRGNQGLAGGGIYTNGTSAVNINNSTFTENTATYNYGGGGIYFNSGSLNINNSIITNNTSTFSSGGGGGISIGGSANFTIKNSVITENTAESAGGISAGGTGAISGSIISNNRATRLAGGIYSGGTISLIDSTISKNTVTATDGKGGGIYNFGRLSVTDSIVTENTAAVGGGIFTSGGLNATGLTLSNNSSVSNGGGGIYNNAGGLTALPVTLNNSVISGNNSSGFGGGMYNRDQMNLVNTTVRNNSAALGGGGIFNVFLNVGAATLSAKHSTINGNTSNAAGGGIANQAGTVNLTNTTVSGNKARGIGGGITTNNEGKINLTNSTIAFNNATAGTGGGLNNTSGSINARNTIIARNTIGNGQAFSDLSGMLNSQGYNFVENRGSATVSGDTTGNIYGSDPQLLPLDNFGGTTQTHALKLNSPALDKGNSFGSTADQRDRTRPFDNRNIPNAAGGNGADIGAFERQETELLPGNTQFDFDGDGRADVSVFRPESGVWHLQQSNLGYTAPQFGVATDKLVPADYDGDGKTDLAVFRENPNDPGKAKFYILNSSNNQFRGEQLGSTGDIPVAGDWDGDGRADVGVYRNGTQTNQQGYFYYRPSSQPNVDFVPYPWGITGDKPVVADFDGDGKADPAVFRPATGEWFVQRSRDGFYAIQFGALEDKPVVGDYDGDGKADQAVFRPSNGVWYIWNSRDGFSAAQFGISTDLPSPGDYDGDGKTDMAVYRDGNWFLLNSTNGFTALGFGTAADKPVPNSFVP